MKKVKSNNTESTPKRRPKPAASPEARENQMISLAISLAEQQLLDGTASSQVITHYLRLGSMKEQLEREKLEEENKLLKAKTEMLESQKRTEELYLKALDAMRQYSGIGEMHDPDIQ